MPQEESEARRRSLANATAAPNSRSSSFQRMSRVSSSLVAARPVEFGSGSIFDAEVSSADKLPFKFPVAKYLEEALVGLCGAPHSFDIPENPEKARAIWKRMKRVVGMENTSSICESLAWVCIGVLFGTVADAALEGLRARLSRSWFLLTIDLGRTEFIGNLAVGSRDAVLDTLPTLLVQVILRLVIDAFPTDQMELLRNVEGLIDKLTSIVHKEALGYPLHRDVALNLRRGLFRPKVLEKPHVNTVETIQSVKRLTVMENAQAQLRPLTFGAKRSQPLEEQQLEHIMELRDEQLEQDRMKRSPSKQASGHEARETRELHPLQDMVDKYQTLAAEGEEFFLQQLENMEKQAEAYQQLKEEEDSACFQCGQEGYIATPLVSPPQTPPKSGPEKSDPTEVRRASSEAALGSQTSETKSSFVASMRPTMRRTMRRSFCLTCTATTATNTLRLMRERRELEAAERRRRDEVLMTRIAAPLPENYSWKPVERSRVSPIISRQLGMDPDSMPSPAARKWSRKSCGSRSSPTLVPGAKPNDEALPDIGSGPAAAAAAVASATAVAAAVVAAAGGGGRQRGRRKFTLKDSGSRGYGDSSQEKGSRLPSPMSRREQTITIDLNAQQSIKGHESLKRLEQQREAITQNSFDQYKREFDLETGVRKQKLDGAKIKRDEIQYIETLETLVGCRSEPALRLPAHQPSRPMGPRSLSDIRGTFGSEEASPTAASP